MPKSQETNNFAPPPFLEYLLENNKIAGVKKGQANASEIVKEKYLKLDRDEKLPLLQDWFNSLDKAQIMSFNDKAVKTIEVNKETFYSPISQQPTSSQVFLAKVIMFAASIYAAAAAKIKNTDDPNLATFYPSISPTIGPSFFPTSQPSNSPSGQPTDIPTAWPSTPSSQPSSQPSSMPSFQSTGAEDAHALTDEQTKALIIFGAVAGAALILIGGVCYCCCVDKKQEVTPVVVVVEPDVRGRRQFHRDNLEQGNASQDDINVSRRSFDSLESWRLDGGIDISNIPPRGAVTPTAPLGSAKQNQR